MVELEDVRVVLAAIDALVGGEVAANQLARPTSSLPPPGRDLPAVKVTAVSEVLSEALPAPPLKAVAIFVEAGFRKLLATLSTAPDTGRSSWRRVAKNGKRDERERRRDVARPHARRRERNVEFTGDPP
jgi:hypothetical protein